MTTVFQFASLYDGGNGLYVWAQFLYVPDDQKMNRVMYGMATANYSVVDIVVTDDERLPLWRIYESGEPDDEFVLYLAAKYLAQRGLMLANTEEQTAHDQEEEPLSE